jgi:hypothetical protein
MKHEKQDTQAGVVSNRHGKAVSIIDLFFLGVLGGSGF